MYVCTLLCIYVYMCTRVHMYMSVDAGRCVSTCQYIMCTCQSVHIHDVTDGSVYLPIRSYVVGGSYALMCMCVYHVFVYMYVYLWDLESRLKPGMSCVCAY